jgi:predicted component of type VI protein secretion system
MKQSDPIKSHITALIEKYERRIESIKNTFFVNTYEAGRADGAMSELEEVIEDLKCVRDAVDA